MPLADTLDVQKVLGADQVLELSAVPRPALTPTRPGADWRSSVPTRCAAIMRGRCGYSAGSFAARS